MTTSAALPWAEAGTVRSLLRGGGNRRGGRWHASDGAILDEHPIGGKRCPAMQRYDPILEGERVLVRLPRPTDARAIARYYRENDAHLSRFESPKPRSFLTAGYWWREAERRREALRRDVSARMFLFDREGGLTGDDRTVLGAVGLTSILRGSFHAGYLGYSVAEAMQGRGLMHEALELVVGFAFRDLNLHRIMANHGVRNVRSARVLERLGFEAEGRARDWLIVNGVWEDHVLTARINPDWKMPTGTSKRGGDDRVVEADA